MTGEGGLIGNCALPSALPLLSHKKTDMNPRHLGCLSFFLATLLPGLAWAQPPLPVQTVSPQTEELRTRIEVPGTLLAQASITLRSPVSERVSAVHFAEGQQVEAGMLLLELDRLTEQAQLKLAQAQLTEARLALARTLKLSGSRAVSEADLDTARVQVDVAEARVEAAQAAIREREVHAPFAGRVGLSDVENGSYLTAGDAITTLHNLSRLRVEFDLPQSQLSLFRKGLNLRFRLLEAGDASWLPAELISNASSLNTTTRSLRLRAETDNNPQLWPGLAVVVEISGPPHTALTIPEAALIPRGGAQFVYLARDGKAERVAVTTGLRRDGRVEIVNGLSLDDAVVLRGGDRLRPGTPVQPRPAE